MENQFLEIPDSFWGLFRSKNRQVYIDALLQINEEYQYSNYFLSREICIQTLSDYFAKTRVVMVQDELEDELDMAGATGYPHFKLAAEVRMAPEGG